MELTTHFAEGGHVNYTRKEFIDEKTNNKCTVWYVSYDQHMQFIFAGDLESTYQIPASIQKYYVLKVNDKYVFMDKDGAVSLTDTPLSFFDANIFDNELFIPVFNNIDKFYETSEVNSRNGMYTKELLTEAKRKEFSFLNK